MYQIYIFLISAIITCGMNMPGPVNRPPSDRHVRWSQSNVYFPGPTNHHFYYPQAPDKVNQNVNRQNVRPATSERPNSSLSPPRPVTSIDKGNDDEEVCRLDNNLPDPESQCCGVEASSRNFIVGGNVTNIEQYPWLARIEYYNEAQKRFKTLCGGFLISGRYVLTAAHCLVGEILELGKPTNVILGEYNSTHDGPDCTGNRPGARSCSDGAIKVPIQNVVVHDEHTHDKNASFNDIALIRLKETVQFTNFIRPLCIPNVDVTASPPPNLRFFVAGWGAIKQKLVFQSGQKTFAGEYDNVKRDVDLPYRDVEHCRAKLGSFVGDSHICAGGEKGKDSCRGDSGGPLMYERDGVFEAVGIVSAGSGKKPCGTEDYPAIYTKVFKYREWLDWHTRF